MKKKKMFRRVMTLLFTLFVALGAVPQTAFAAGENQELGTVKVTVENDIWSVEDGADWTGKLITDKSVAIDGKSTLLTILKSALESEKKSMNDIKTETVSEINGIANGEAGNDCVWKFFVGDKDTEQHFSDYSVAKGNIANGSVIKLKYSGTVSKKAEPTVEKTVKEVNETPSVDKTVDGDSKTSVLYR